jgi:cytochrome b561
MPLKAIGWGALRGVLILAALLLLSLGGCTFEVEHTAHGYHFSAGVVVLVLVVLAMLVAICEWIERP